MSIKLQNLNKTSTLFIVAVVFSISLLIGLQQPKIATAFTDKATGDRLLNEYRSNCSDYDPRKKAHQSGKKWNRCKKVREALTDSAGCSFGKGKASKDSLDKCQTKIDNRFGKLGTQTNVDLKPLEDVGASADNGTINSIKNIVFSLAGGLSLLFVVIGGVRYIVSQGDPNATSQAKNTILYALVGLVVTVFAYAIVGFVIGNL